MSKALSVTKNNLSEHFDNFVVVAIDEDSNLIWDYSNWMVALMLLERAKQGISEATRDLGEDCGTFIEDD